MENQPQWFINLLLDSFSELKKQIKSFNLAGSAICEKTEKNIILKGYVVRTSDKHFTFIGVREKSENETEILLQKQCPLPQ